MRRLSEFQRKIMRYMLRRDGKWSIRQTLLQNCSVHSQGYRIFVPLSKADEPGFHKEFEHDSCGGEVEQDIDCIHIAKRSCWPGQPNRLVLVLGY